MDSTVDDASEDETGAVATAVDDPRVRLIRNRVRRGISYCHNKVIAESRAAYIVHLDSDDLLIRRNAFRKLLDRIQEDDSLGLVHAHFMIVDQHGHLSRDRYYDFRSFQLQTRQPGRDYRSALLNEGSVINALRLFRKSIFKKTGPFDESLPYGEDYEMALRIAQHYQIDVVPEALIAVREHDQSTTSLKLRWFRYWWQRVNLAAKLSKTGQITYANHRIVTMIRGLFEALGWNQLVLLTGQFAHHVRERLRQGLRRQKRLAYDRVVRCMRWWPLRPWPFVRRKRKPGPGLCAYYLWEYPAPSETFVRREIAALAAADIPIAVFAERKHPEAHTIDEPAPASAGSFFLDELTETHAWRCLSQIIRNKPVRYLYLCLYTIFHHYGFHKSLAEDLSLIRQSAILAGVLKDHGVTHVHAPWGDRSAFVAMLAAELLGVSYSVQVRAHELHRKLQVFGLREKFSAAAFVITNSEYNRRFIASKLGPRDQAKVHLMYEGIRPEDFQPVALRARTREPLGILCVARLIEEKGLIHLLLACKELRKRGVDFLCEIVGGPERPTYTAYEIELRTLHRRLQLDPYVKFSGMQPFNEVMRRYRAADIFVLPCVTASNGGRDITPNALIEAMACGLPVVSSNMTAIPEIIEDGKDGLLVPPGNPVAIADAIQQLANDIRLCECLSINARKKVARKFNSASNINTLAGLLTAQIGIHRSATIPVDDSNSVNRP